MGGILQEMSLEEFKMIYNNFELYTIVRWVV